MKKLIALTAIAATVATGAFAMVDASVNLDNIERYAPYNADVSTLTEAEILTLLAAIHGGGSESEKRSVVRSFFVNR
ncbi:MAG TPA: hypothetical protein VK854_07890 [Woeseiaceae bacterium]|nr:hypothetical protein [Woeseiaceae bacterium]